MIDDRGNQNVFGLPNDKKCRGIAAMMALINDN